MKLHRSTTEAVVHALEAIFVQKKYADKVIERILKQNPRWGARDRRFIAETTYDVVRWYRWLLEIGEGQPNDFWKLIATYFRLHGVLLPPWNEFKDLNDARLFQRQKEVENIRKIRQSIPDWLDKLGEDELGERWGEELAALNNEAAVVLRANTLKTTGENLQQILHEEKVETYTVPTFTDALILKERQNVFRLKSFQDGLFEVQDAASQLVAPFLQIEPGIRVIDACAGAGGKTLHLASLMRNKGRLIAMDVEQWKLDELQKRARRAGISNMETKLIDSSKAVKRLAGSADRLLLDVPCSGLGVLRRNPDAKWKLSEEFIDQVRQTQQNILDQYSAMVKPGGLMVYATCSILPGENEMQVRQFLSEQGNDFDLVEEHHAWPSEGFDGFYMARVKRKE
ncbi:MAG TPA: methyltransferase domain-containing protein [Cyclobacteriaceae bacterium]|nr:methyltransferase domain-containing protein [Cyclobacteriaceae bacterium]